ncbi:protein phosphatase 1L isoform X2 [Amblyomma americanum]
MEDELEDELVQEIFWAHVSLVSRAARADLRPMADAAAFYLRLYVLRPGTLAVFVALLAAVLLCQSTTEAWLRLLLRRCELRGDAVKQMLRRGPPERRSWEAKVASDYAQQHLFASLMPKLVAAAKRRRPDEPVEQLLAEFTQLLTDAILQLDADLLAILKERHDLSGSTLLVALVYGSRLVVANVGDSRGVLADLRGQALPLSFDHKPQQLKEHKRIREAGGFITFNGVWRVAGVLATSRALGDYPLKERHLLVAQPDVLTFDLSEGAACAVLASDGLWDALSNEQAAALALAHLDEPLHGARELALRAYSAGSLDNITALVVDLRNASAKVNG